MAPLPPNLEQARNLLGLYGPMQVDQLVDALAPLGVHLPADRLLAFLLRYPEHFQRLADGRIALTQPGPPAAPSADPGFQATDEPDPDVEPEPEPERPWWTDQPDLSTTWDDVFVLPTPDVGRCPALVWHVGGQRWLRPPTAGAPVPIPHPGPCLLTWAPQADKVLAAAVELPSGATESFRAFDVATLALLVDPTAPAADLDELCHHLGLPTAEPTEPVDPAEPSAGQDANPGTAHDPAVDEIHALMRVIGALAQRAPGGPTWQLALRLLAEDGSPWPALVGATRPPEDLAAAIRTRPDPLCRRAPGTDLGPHALLRTANGLPAAFRRLADARADYQQRPAQHEMARIVAEALDAGHPAAIEAPTGTGKSIGYLLPAAVRTATRPRDAIVVATHTKVLQRQLRDTAEQLRAAGLLPAPFRQLYGVTNYVCPREVVDAIRSGEPPAGSWRPVAVALRALETAPAGVWDDIGDDAVRRAEGYAAGKAALRTTAADCERRRCAWVHQCPLYRRLDELDRDPGIIATNHALVAAAVSPTRRAGELASVLGNERTALLLDEAHTLEDSLSTAWAQQTSSLELRGMLRSLGSGRGALRRARALAPDLFTGERTTALRTHRHGADRALDAFGRAAAVYLAEHGPGAARDGAALLPAAVTRQAAYPQLADAAFRLATALRRLAELLDALANDTAGVGERGVTVAGRLRSRASDLREHAETVWTVRTLPAAHAMLHLLEREHPTQPADDVADEAAAQPDDEGPIEWRFRRIPIEVADAFAGGIVAVRRTTILTSATLRAGGSFTFLGQRLGLRITDAANPGPHTTTDRFDEDAFDDEGDEVDGTDGYGTLGSSAAHPPIVAGHRLDSPFDHNTNSLVILTNHLPIPVGRTEAAFCEALARDQAGFLSLTGGRSLALFAARSRMAATAAHLAPLRPALADRGVTLLVQGEHSPGAIHRRFRQDHGTALFGLRSYWEGFDAPGDTLSYLLIEKAPYGHPEEPITAARLQAIADAGGDPFADYTLPRAAIQLAQGFGRLLRTEHDRGVALIADPRLQTPSAANRFLLDSLPTTKVVHANGRDHAWTTAITFVTGHPPDLATAPLRDHADLQSRLAALRLVDGEDPTVKLLDAARAFGVEDLRPEQLDIMRALLAGRDVLGFFPTGWGKSICFQLPALLAPAGRLTLVVSPLIALIKDQLDDLAGRRGLANVVGLSSRAAKGHNAAQLQRIATGQVNLLYVSPERLAHDPVLHRTLATIPLGAVVVDEAHCVSSWGFDFRPEFRQVAKAVASLPRTARAGLTATATEGVEADLRASLRLQDPLVLRQPASRSDLQFWVHRVGDDRDRARELLRFVLHQDGEPGLIYASRRALTEEIAWLLRQCGHRARAFHAGMRPDEKEHAQDDFLNGDTTIMVATKAFGMGVNKSDIGWVAHWDPPDGIDAYVQEAGRAARHPDAHGRCLLLYSDADLRRLARLVEREHAAENAGVAARLLAEIQTWPQRNGKHLVNGDELAGRLQLDDDDLPSRMVAWLEDVGNVTRGTDAVATAMVAWHGREPADRVEQRRFFELRRLLGVRIGVRRRIDIDRAAARTGWDADELEAQLLDWSLTGLLTFVVTGRRWRIAVTDPHPQAATLRQLAGRWRDLQRNRLEHLQRYTTTMCRRTTIAAVFGDSPVACRAGVDDPCDVCAGGPPPWHAVPLSMVPDPEQLIDAEHTVLQLVRWATRGTHRYGEATLGAALLGLETVGTAPITASLLRCPQFGAFRYVHDNRALLRGTVDRLLGDGLVRRITCTGPNGPYPALELTDAGRYRTGGFRG